jgi:hypothetical protein
MLPVRLPPKDRTWKDGISPDHYYLSPALPLDYRKLASRDTAAYAEVG